MLKINTKWIKFLLEFGRPQHQIGSHLTNSALQELESEVCPCLDTAWMDRNETTKQQTATTKKLNLLFLFYYLWFKKSIVLFLFCIHKMLSYNSHIIENNIALIWLNLVILF